MRRFYVNDQVSGWGRSGAHLVSGRAAFAQRQTGWLDHERGRSRCPVLREVRDDYRSRTAAAVVHIDWRRKRSLVVVDNFNAGSAGPDDGVGGVAEEDVEVFVGFDCGVSQDGNGDGFGEVGGEGGGR